MGEGLRREDVEGGPATEGDVISWLLLIGCMRTISLQVLRPADVALPPHIQHVAVVDRSGPADVREGVMGTIEGIATGEEPFADRHAAQEAVRGVAESLRASPRFRVEQPFLDKDRRESSLFDRELSFRAAREICRPYRCQAVIALEAFDSDSTITMERRRETEETDAGRERTIYVFEAERQTQVLSAWRIYDLEGRGLVDDLRDFGWIRSWSGEGRTEQRALASLPSLYDTIQAVGYDAGRAYGQRIAPTWVWVDRRYFSNGSPAMREARDRARATDWDGAAKIWRKLARSGDPKVAAKARFNLALYHEVHGRLAKAEDKAVEAAGMLSRASTREYVWVLQRRQADEARLREQMRPPGAPTGPR